MAQSEDLYAILGVSKKATHAEIQSAFKKRARELHPDVNKAPDAEDKFKALSSAYEVLKDEAKRKQYDLGGLNPQRRRPPGAARRGTRPPPGFEEIDFDFENPFDFVMNRQGRGRTRRDQEVKLSIPLEDAYKGTTLNVTLEAPPATGEASRFKIRIPPGAKDGDRLKLKDPPITVILSIDPHPRYEIDGRDLSTTLSIAPWEAALGGEVELSTPGGSVKVRIPTGTSTGQKLRLRGQGLPVKPGKTGEPGDIFVRIKVVLPKTSSDRAKALWKELAEESDFDPRSEE